MKKILVLLVGVALLSLGSCYKNPENGFARIKVVNSLGFRVPSANITLSQPGQNNNGYIHVQGLTDANGEFLYEHDPALEVILKVDVVSGPSVGTGMVRISPDKTTDETITIYP